jgi:FixJ family two-component response regulator
MPSDELGQQFMFAKLHSEIPKQLPILFLTETMTAELMHLSMQFQKVRFLKVPTDPLALYENVQDSLRTYRKGKQQLHPRFQTSTPASVEVLSTGIKLQALMKNLSMTGAYFEADVKEHRLKISDKVKIKIETGEPAKVYFFEGKIVWTKLQKPPYFFGFGVVFFEREKSIEDVFKDNERN